MYHLSSLGAIHELRVKFELNSSETETMSRSVPWRRACPDQVIRRIEEALQARVYILRETGPTGFLVKEDGLDVTFKVITGKGKC